MALLEQLGVLLRGGVSVGGFYQNKFTEDGNLFVFSQGLIAAYQLQEKIEMPKIAITDNCYKSYCSPELEKQFPKGKKTPVVIGRGSDGIYFLDSYASAWPAMGEANYLSVQNQLRNILKNAISKKDSRVMRKVCWFVNYHNQSIGHLNSIIISHSKVKDPRALLVELPKILDVFN